MRVRLITGIAPGAELVNPDPDSPVRLRRSRCQAPRKTRIRTARSDPGVGSRKRCKRRRAPKAGTAVEPLGSSDLGPATGKQVSAQRAAAFADGAGGEHRFDEVAARLVASLRALRSIGVAGFGRRETSVPRSEQRAVARIRRRGQKQNEQDGQPSHQHVVPSGP